jgi:hypothetical protein
MILFLLRISRNSVRKGEERESESRRLGMAGGGAGSNRLEKIPAPVFRWTFRDGMILVFQTFLGA